MSFVSGSSSCRPASSRRGDNVFWTGRIICPESPAIGRMHWRATGNNHWWKRLSPLPHRKRVQQILRKTRPSAAASIFLFPKVRRCHIGNSRPAGRPDPRHFRAGSRRCGRQGRFISGQQIVSNDAAVGAEFENMRSDGVDKQDRPAGMISSAINVAGIMLAGRQQSKTIAVL